jgi:hypothetical protein
MPIPNVSLNVRDRGLGASVPGAGGTMVVIGCSSSGTDYEVFASTQPDDFADELGYGPCPELAAFVASETGNPVIAIKAPTATPGTNSAVSATRVASSTCVVSLSGAPVDTYYAVLRVLTGGTIGTAGIVLALSLDNERTRYITINLGAATAYTIPNTGLTLSFSAGTLDEGDVFQWVSTEPRWSTAGVVSCIEQLYGVVQPFQDVAIVGGGSSATEGGVGASGADVTTIQAAMVALFGRRRFSRALMNARDVLRGGTSTESENAWMTSLTSDFVSVEANRVGVTAGHYNATSPLSQVQFRRPLLFQALARDASVAIHVDLARVSDGSLASTPSSPPSVPDGFVYHDEDQRPGLDAARFITARRFPQRPGIYITNPYLMSAPGSDFGLLQHGHVIDVATSIAYQYFVEKLSDSVRIDSSTGKIMEIDAQALEGGCNAQLRAGLVDPGSVSSASCVVNRTTNILSTKTLYVSVNVVPLGYFKTISVTIGFQNPALLASS